MSRDGVVNSQRRRIVVPALRAAINTASAALHSSGTIGNPAAFSPFAVQTLQVFGK